MPFYEYECSACKFYVEALQKISDEPLKKCPSCKKSALKRLMSAPVFRLKGSGWYETDFKSDQDNKRNLVGDEKEVAPAAKPDAKPEAAVKPDSKSTETKTEAKSESTKSSSKSASKSKAKPKAKPAAKKK